MSGCGPSEDDVINAVKQGFIPGYEGIQVESALNDFFDSRSASFEWRGGRKTEKDIYSVEATAHYNRNSPLFLAIIDGHHVNLLQITLRFSYNAKTDKIVDVVITGTLADFVRGGELTGAILDGKGEAGRFGTVGFRDSRVILDVIWSPEAAPISTIKEDNVITPDSQINNSSSNTIELAQLIGQTSDDVIQLLGQPEDVRNFTPGVETWLYGTRVGPEGYPGLIYIDNDRVYNITVAFDYESEFSVFGAKCFANFLETGEKLENLGLIFSHVDDEFYNDGVKVWFFGDVNEIEVAVVLDATLSDFTFSDSALPNGSVTIHAGNIFTIGIFDTKTFFDIHGWN